MPLSKTSRLPDALVADANALISAVLGGRAAGALVFSLEAGIHVYSAREVADEVREWLPVLARKRGLEEDLLLGTFAMMPVEWKEPAVTARYKDEALRRIGARDPDDWPTVALAIDTSHEYRHSAPPEGAWARKLWSADVVVRHRMNDLLLEMQSPMTSPGKPIKRNPKTLTGMLLHRALNRPSRLVHKSVAIWSADKDYEVTGLTTVRTGELLRMLGK
ncbi:hypothetical protein EPN29_09335 [bacterium]|nr:MAG: hypothetical protein EPN29_09335 [bacterium]